MHVQAKVRAQPGYWEHKLAAKSSDGFALLALSSKHNHDEWRALQKFLETNPAQLGRGRDVALPEGALHDVDARRPRPPGARAQDGARAARGGGRRARARGAVLGEHRGRPRRRRRQQAARLHVVADVCLPGGGARALSARRPRVALSIGIKLTQLLPPTRSV